jgi:hypothetical protein
MRMLCSLLLTCLFTLPALAQQADGRLYGKVTDAAGQTYEGYLRWDKNEVGWVDLLDGTKPRAEVADAPEGHRALRLFGFRLIGDVRGLPARRTFDLRGSNDVDRHNAGIGVAGSGGGVAPLDWDAFERVVFEKP